MKKLLFLILLSPLLFVTGCGKSVNDQGSPEEFIVSYLKNLDSQSPEKLAKLFAKKSLVYENYSEEEAINVSKKLLDDMRFSGSEIEDVKIDDIYNYDKDTVIAYVTYKLKFSPRKSPEVVSDVFVLSKEKNKWRINIRNVIAEYEYDNCSEQAPIKLCISKAIIYPENTIIVGNIENSSQDTYIFGFASPARTIIKILDKTIVDGEYPSIHNGQSQNSIPTGKQDVEFFFGSDLNPLLVKSKPISISINDLQKISWVGMPEINAEKKEITIQLSEKK